MARDIRHRDILKNIRISKHKSIVLFIHIVYTQFYPGYRIKAKNNGDKDYNEIFVSLTFYQKIEEMNIQFSIVDERSLPF